MTALAPGVRLTESLTLVRVLGEGGMGTVWLASHRALGSEVAVKVMHADLARRDPSLLDRFAAEARAAAKVRHPHIVQVLDYGTTSEGVAWLSMERLEGRALREVLEAERRLAPFYVREVVAQTASALTKAHEVGVIHRDLKPENVFVTMVSGKPYVKVLDFGIAKLSMEASGRTATGAVFGTPAYMSLEQLKSAKNVDAKADLWSLSVVAYELLTGRLPFEGETSSAIVLAVASGEYAAASSLATELGSSVDAFFARAFAKDPSARFASAEELATAFAAALDGTAPSSSAPRARPAATELQLPTPFAAAGRKGATEVGGAPRIDGPASAPNIPAAPRVDGDNRPSRFSTARVLAACVVAAVTMVGIAKLMESSRGATGASATPPATNIPAGKVTLGETHATSDVAAFSIDRTEVTTAAYAACVKSGKCTKAATWEDCNAGVAGRENHPINCVDWNQAKAYCEAQGQRLPTEKEWEYAATGGDGRTYPWGNAEPSNQLCWDGEGSGNRQSTCAVGSYPNGNSPFGLSDMSGNVWEWTSSASGSSFRAYRGGSWQSVDPSIVRSASRSWDSSTNPHDYLGFRCAGSPLP